MDTDKLENAYYEAKAAIAENAEEAKLRLEGVLTLEDQKSIWGIKTLKQLIRIETQQVSAFLQARINR